MHETSLKIMFLRREGEERARVSEREREREREERERGKRVGERFLQKM